MTSQIYSEMNTRNGTAAPRPYDSSSESSDCCISAWSGEHWSLLPAYRRLIEHLGAIAGDYFTFYWPEEAAGPADGILHQTLLQIVGFDTFDRLNRHTVPTIMEGAATIIRAYPLPLKVEYRGLVWTTSGLALAGYTDDYDRLLELRGRLGSIHGSPVPYKNDIVHATCARWKAEPPADVLFAVRQEVERWSEATFGSIMISDWTIGTCTLLMRPGDRHDYTTVRCPLRVYHRGNSARDLSVENNPKKLLELVRRGRHIELDIWTVGNKLFVGHDRPDVEVTYDWLLAVEPRALIHCKDGRTFSVLRRYFACRGIAANLFYHTSEDYALSTGGWVITYPGKPVFGEFLSMMPETAGRNPNMEAAAIICSDKLA
jgi:hypothetical protein